MIAKLGALHLCVPKTAVSMVRWLTKHCICSNLAARLVYVCSNSYPDSVVGFVGVGVV